MSHKNGLKILLFGSLILIILLFFLLESLPHSPPSSMVVKEGTTCKSSQHNNWIYTESFNDTDIVYFCGDFILYNPLNVQQQVIIWVYRGEEISYFNHIVYAIRDVHEGSQEIEIPGYFESGTYLLVINRGKHQLYKQIFIVEGE
jgi:hypothetical protein